MNESTITRCRSFLSDQRVIEQFAAEYDMVPRKHAMSRELLAYYTILSDLEKLKAQPESRKKESLVESLNKELDVPAFTLNGMVQDSLNKIQDLELQVSKLKVELDNAKGRSERVQKKYDELFKSKWLEEESALRWIHSNIFAALVYKISHSK